MTRSATRILVLASVLLAASTKISRAHFVFVVPGKGGEATVLMSETLKPEDEVNVAIIKGTKLSVKTADGTVPLALRKGSDNAYHVVVPGSGKRVLHGSLDLGVTQRGEVPNVLRYYPKTVLGAADGVTIGDLPVEIVVVKAGEGIKLKVLGDGKPQSNSEVTIILPDGSQEIARTDKDGLTETYTKSGRYGAWARFWEDTPGERDGKKYAQVRSYATLVFDNGGAGIADAVAEQKAISANASAWLKLPEATSSFGGVGLDGWFYVYGGHTAPTHEYHTTAVSGNFFRADIAQGKSWEKLPAGPGLQGMNLAAADGMVYRIGGMQPQNKQGDPTDNRSVAENARFNPAKMAWETLPALPEGRSSHDFAVLDGKLYVIGGWKLNGPQGNTWPEAGLVLDLAGGTEWKTFAQPFTRRALIAATHGGRLYAIGGFDKTNAPSLRVDIYDPAATQWSAGPELPGETMNGFSPAACEVDGQLFVSVGDGNLFRLNDDAKRWELIAWTTPRIVHRLIPSGGRILVAGGAAEGGNLDLVEVVKVGGE